MLKKLTKTKLNTLIKKRKESVHAVQVNTALFTIFK